MEELFRAVREACTARDWSRGVEISRSGAVTGESAGEDEVVLHIDTRQGMFCPKVTLYLDDDEWECNCPSRRDVCEHVAAAVIALKRAREEGRDLPGTESAPARIVYRFRRATGGLWFERGVEGEDGFQAIEATLDAVASGRVDGPRFMATEADLHAEVALGSRRIGIIERQAIPRLFAALARCEDVRLDGEPVRVSTREVLPVAVLEEYGEGFRLSLQEDPGVVERFDNGIVLHGDNLRPVGVPDLTGREIHEYGQGKIFTAGAVAELVAEVLPSLRKRIPVDCRSERLPEAVRERPRIVVETETDGERLSVIASLVYGDPPVAKIESGRLVPLGNRVPHRDEDRERALVKNLGRTLGLAPGFREHFEAEAAVAFTRKLGEWRGGLRGVGHHGFRMAPPLVPSLRVRGSDFDLDFRVSDPTGETATSPAPSGGGRGPDPAAVLQAWRDGRSLVPLPDGGWSPLPKDWLGKFGHRIADLMAARTGGGDLPPCAIPDLALLCEELDQPPPPAFESLRAVLEDFAGIPQSELPADLDAELRPYQVTGVHWMAFLRDAGLGAMLADDMGLGKTLQALCVLRGRALVVAPTSVVHNWMDEASRFRPRLRLCRYHGPRRELDPGADLTITSYALLRMDREILSAVDWDVVVLDEAQAIKNPESQVAQAAYTLRGRFRVSLSGTPVENRLDELWSQFHFINRGLLGGLSDFQERYARPILDGDESAAARLRERIRPFLLRRLKREVAPELPRRSDVILHCDLTDGEREVYDAIRAATLEEVVRKLKAGGSVMAAFEALLRLRQAACHASLVPGQHAESSSKTALLMTCLESAAADGHKALVFSQWTSLLDLIEPHLREAGIRYLRLDGSTRDREGVVNGFQDEAGPPVLLLSLKAGGTGLNLTAADHVFLMDPWWNPAVEEQAADRAHRIGQDRPVLVYRLVTEETVEERILALQARKREIAEMATGAPGRASEITREDLLALLE